MENFYITQYSIGFISPAILSLIISGAILFKQIRDRSFTPDRVSLALYFFGASIYNLMNFFGFSIYSADAQIAWYIESFTPFAVLFLIRFAYYYPSLWHETERKIVMITGSLLSAAAIMEYWINSWNSPVRLFGHTYGAEYFSSAIPLLNAVFYLWGAAVFIRRAVEFEKQSGSTGKLFNIIINPASRDAKTARTFAGLILLDVVHSFIVYGGMNRVSMSIFVISFTTTMIVLLILSLYATVYLHASYDNIPFIYKLTGIPLVIILLIVTASSYMMMYFRSVSYDELKHAMIEEIKVDGVEPGIRGQSIKKSKDEGQSLRTENLPVSYISIAGDKVWYVIYDKNSQLPDTVESGLWAEAPSGMQMKTGRGLVDFSMINPEEKYFLQIDNINYHQYNRKIGDKVYGFGITYLDYLRYMQRTGSLILAVMIFSIILIITFLPVLYHFGIIGPLRRMIHNSSAVSDRVSLMGNEIKYIEKILKNNPESRRSKSLPGKPEEISAIIREKLDTIISYLNDNYHDDISREGLASMVELDPDYISRLFKIYTGMKIGDYINKLRIEEASALLISSEKSVLDISMIAGFESLRTFNRSFFRITGETPTEFRQKNVKFTGQKL